MSDEQKYIEYIKRKQDIQNNKEEEPVYYRFIDKENRSAMDFTDASCGFRSFENIDGPKSSTPELSWDTYMCFRPGEATPRTHAEIMRKCKEIYEECILIKNIVDLMADFTCQGIRISHPQKSRHKFYQDWWKTIHGNTVVERICNYFYRYANEWIKRHQGRITIRRNGEEIHKIIPIKYTFINPALVKVDDPESDSITGDFKYYIEVKKEKLNEQVRKRLSEEIGLIQNEDKVYLTNSKIYKSIFYKKDDWDPFAKPLLYGLIKEVAMLNKLDLAERTALDTAIKHIRIITLGNLEHELVPTSAAFAKLDSLLQNNSGSGMTTLMWGPDIEIKETKTDLHQFLGYDKYIPTIEKIYQGVGIPSLSSGGETANNSFLSLNILMERMSHGRDIVNSFLIEELEHIREVLGDSVRAEIEYDIMNFTDQAAHRALLIQLADRNLISSELLQQYFNHNPNMEQKRIMSELKDADSNKKARRLGPYSEKDFEKSLLKLMISKDMIDPDSLSDNYPRFGDLKFQEIENTSEQPQKGRPLNSKDSQKRQRRSFKPIKAMKMHLWVEKIQEEITATLKPHILQVYKKQSIRELTAQEFKDYEDLKVGVLFNIEYGQEDIAQAIQTPIDYGLVESYKKIIQELSADMNRELTSNEKNTIQAILYYNL